MPPPMPGVATATPTTAARCCGALHHEGAERLDVHAGDDRRAGAAGSVHAQGDESWTRLVKWVHYAMLEAEVLGITQANADQMKAKAGNDPDLRRYLRDRGRFRQAARRR